ncbi:MAG TPA: MBL fold metallo-hydrolase [Bacteroidota bacterium]|nr:MBL fold metallo-hydrolase [Bacteroidota bacterium]
MKVRFWGTRGSIATPGPATLRYGGNTSCVEVRAGEHILVFDAGTGIHNLGIQLRKEFPTQPITVHVFISHTHWDHIQGFPFFLPAYGRQNRIIIYGPPGRDKTLRQIMRMQMDSDYFPVALGDMNPNIEIVEVNAPITIGAISITNFYLNHPAMSLGYRVSDGKRSVVYATDNEPYKYILPAHKDESERLGLPEYLDDKLIEFIDGTDLYIAEAQYTMEEYKGKLGWGHSPIESIVEFSVKGKVKRVALFHHDPYHDDTFIDGMVQYAQKLLTEQKSNIECFGAREGMEVAF